jgi:FkbM family methyltransferase
MNRRVRGALEFVLEQVPYLEKEMLILGDLVSPGDVCLDVGAAGGTYMFLLARHAGAAGRVYAFEPRPRSSRAIALARRLLRLDTVSVHQVGLSDMEGIMRVLVPTWRGIPFTTRAYLASAYGHDADRVPDGFTSVRSLEIPTTTIDRFVAVEGLSRIDFIKADIEGAELSLLEGARDSIGRWHPTVLLEIEERHLGRYGKRASDVIEFMSGNGYRMYAFAEGALVPVEAVTEQENNYVFLPFL